MEARQMTNNAPSQSSASNNQISRHEEIRKDTFQGTKAQLALSYATAGWNIFPLIPDEKRPATAHGLKDASSDPEKIKSWWERWPDANIGIAMPPHLVAVDIDVKNHVNGHTTLAEIAAPHGGVPSTLTAETPSGGWHLYFQKPVDVSVKNRAGIRPGIDVRAQGGYLVAPGSTISGMPYKWINTTQIANCPQWLLEVLTEEKKALSRPPTTMQRNNVEGQDGLNIAANDKYAQAVWGKAVSAILTAVDGTRNETLNASAYGLARLAGAGRLDWPHAMGVLEQAALTLGLPLNEVRKTIASAQSGMNVPNYEGSPDSQRALAFKVFGSTFPDLGDAHQAETTWPEPTPLPDTLTPVAPFDMSLLPAALRAWVADIAHRMQCPPDFAAVGAVAAISSLIGARVVVAPKARDDWRVTPNLWGLIVGRPGVMKSPALSEVLKPLHRLETNERELWEVAHEAWELDCKVAGMAADSNEKQAKACAAKDPDKARALLQPTHTPSEPTMRRYVVNDSTVEKLAELLTVNPWGVLVYRDELHGLLCNMDRQGQEGARGFYLTGYDGNQGHAIDRIGRGESYIPRVCISMLGGIQPGKVQSYVRDAVAGGASDDGLLQRFGLAVWPDVNRDFIYVDSWPNTPAKEAAFAIFERLNQLPSDTDATPSEWRFSPDAQTLFEEWLTPFETEIRGEELHPALVSHLSKYRKLIPALALIFALVDTPDSGGIIHKCELMRALDWCSYLRTHAARLYSAAVIPETTGAKLLLKKIKAGSLRDGDGVLLEHFTPRIVAVKNWTALGTSEAVRKAADLLTEYGWLALDSIPSGAAGGRPSSRYRIHPKVLSGGMPTD